MDKKIGTIITVASIIILVGGLYLMTKPAKPSSATTVNLQDLNGDARHTKGNPSAKVTVVEIADFQCPACATAYPYVKAMIDAHQNDVYYIYRHFPLSQHKNGFIAAEASEAASEQGKFWEMFGLLYEKQKDWQDSDKPVDKFSEYAKELGLNIDQFKKALEDHKFKDVVQKDYEDGLKIGVDATPSFYINGQKYTDNFTFIKSEVEKKL